MKSLLLPFTALAIVALPMAAQAATPAKQPRHHMVHKTAKPKPVAGNTSVKP